ncbi:lipase family protein [Amycolatopsis pigmentata]|uniref:Lipase family protein n=1 Tax=Amycolatopsis pigmentata TaxID=450801 RepID=A0ABW5G5R3_9PSEU
MRRLFRRVAVVVGAAAVTMAFLTASAGAARSPGPVPVPSDDHFYSVPPRLESVPPGAVLRSRRVELPPQSGALSGEAWQVLYRTTDNHWRPTATVETILVPRGLPKPGGARPLLSYQVPEDGLALTCAPSYQLRAGTVGTIQADESSMAAALSRGWTVVVPDYEGPESEFFGAAGTAHGVLDGIRAALRFGPAGVSSRSPVGMWGYSGGGHATAVAAQAQRRYAPELRLSAITMGGLLADGNETLQAVSGTVFSGDIPFALAALEHSYPEAHVERYLNAYAQGLVDSVSHGCTTDAVKKGPFFATLAQFEAYPGSLTGGPFQRFVHDVSPVGLGGIPTAPVHDYHGSEDQLTPVGGDRAVMRQYCAGGATVQHVEYPGDHSAAATAGLPGALAFLDNRFAGAPAPDNCATIPAP